MIRSFRKFNRLNESRFVRRVNSRLSLKESTAVLEDYGLEDTESIVLYVDGDYVDDVVATNKPIMDMLKPLMKILSNIAIKELRGTPYVEHDVFIEFVDRHDNALASCELPFLSTDSLGHLHIDSGNMDIRPSAKTIEALCYSAFDKFCYLPS